MATDLKRKIRLLKGKYDFLKKENTIFSKNNKKAARHLALGRKHSMEVGFEETKMRIYLF